MIDKGSGVGARALWFVLTSGAVWSGVAVVASGALGWLALVPFGYSAVAALTLGLVGRGRMFETLVSLWAGAIVLALAWFVLAGDPGSRLAAVPFGIVVVVPAATVLFLFVLGLPLFLDHRVSERQLA